METSRFIDLNSPEVKAINMFTPNTEFVSLFGKKGKVGNGRLKIEPDGSIYVSVSKSGTSISDSFLLVYDARYKSWAELINHIPFTHQK